MIAELVACLLLLALSFFYRRRVPNRPPGPFQFPVVGNLPQLLSLSHRSLGKLSRRHGPLVLLQVGPSLALVASSAATAREVLKTNDLVFASRPRLVAAEHLFYGLRDVTFAPYGEHWRQARRVCVLHLFNARRVQSYRSVREEEVLSVVEEIRRSSSTGPVNLSEVVRVFTSGVASRVALGKKYQERWQIIDQLAYLLGETFAEDFFPSLTWLSRATGKHSRLRRCFRELNSFLEEVVEDHVERHRAGGGDIGNADLVDVLLALQKDDEAGIFLTRGCIKAIILDMFAAGTETSAVTLEWAMSELVRRPTMMRKAQEEVRAIAGTIPMVTEDDLGEMRYVKAVIKETLRLHPPIPLLIPRESRSEAVVSGFHIPAGTRVLINAWAIGRDPQDWEEPEEFAPERFLLSGSPDYRGQDFHYLPFGAGRRMCPAIAFANASMELILANLLHMFDWELPEGMGLEDLDMAETLGGATAPRKTSLVLVAVPRDARG